MTTISPSAVFAAQREGTPHDLIDVRTPAEWASVHAVGARHLPMDQVDAAALPKDRPVWVLCAGGVRAKTVCERLAVAGLANCAVVEGGTNAWAAAGLPVVRKAAKPFGVERQVRTIIGLGVLAGALLAWFVHPGFVWLSGFFGAGLLMAGLTDVCPLATLVAAMPWNCAAKPAAAGGSCCTPPAAGGSCCTPAR